MRFPNTDRVASFVDDETGASLMEHVLVAALAVAVAGLLVMAVRK